MFSQEESDRLNRIEELEIKDYQLRVRIHGIGAELDRLNGAYERLRSRHKRIVKRLERLKYPCNKCPPKEGE